jgi:hypothetical protein
MGKVRAIHTYVPNPWHPLIVAKKLPVKQSGTIPPTVAIAPH